MAKKLDDIVNIMNRGFTAEAVVTPFTSRGVTKTKYLDLPAIDFGCFDNLCNDFLESGGSGIVFAGTTGESPTLTFDEHLELIKRGNEIVSNFPDALSIAGTGSNATHEALLLTKEAEDLGSDCALVVSPYYNRPTQEGYYEHIKTIMNNTKRIPIILYEIFGRTGFRIESKTLRQLKDDFGERILAIKDAGNSKEYTEQYASFCPDVILLSGDDNRTREIISEYNGKGVISVVSHIVPYEIQKLVYYSLHPNEKEDGVLGSKVSDDLNKRLEKLVNAMFVSGNPASVKTALGILGKIEPILRLSLVPANEEKTKIISEALYDYSPKLKESYAKI